MDGSDEYESLPTDTAGAYSLAGSVTWGDLEPELYEEAIPDIKEINVETASIVYDYIIISSTKY